MPKTRERAIETVKRRLLQNGLPRFQVSLILLLTGISGFLASYSLLRMGLGLMWLRYSLAILIAYCVFLLLLRLWLFLQSKNASDSDTHLDLSDVNAVFGDTPSYESARPAGGFSGTGGDAGGGGAGFSWENQSPVSAPSTPSTSDSSSALSDVGTDLDLEGGWLIVVGVIALVGGILASLYIIYIAPALLAEILVDGLLLTGLYKRLKGVEQRHWLRAAVRQTLLPALLVVALFTAAGYALQKAVPEARSISEVWQHIARD